MTIKQILHIPFHWFTIIKITLQKPRYNSKIFCIGFNKTGTTTIGKSLELLGYRNSSFNKKIWRKYYKKNKMVKVLQYTAKFDSTDDLPWLKVDMIPVLDRVFPNSKFIYLTRDEDSWKQFLYNWSYKVKGQYPDVEKAYMGYKNHEKFVFDYFANFPEDRFIVLDVKDENGFRKLAEFLGKKPLQDAFPHFNKTNG